MPGISDPEIERIEDLAGLSALTVELASALEELPEEQRRAVQLRVVDEYGYEAVAGALGVSEQTARARVSRGLRALVAASRRARAGSGGRGMTALEELRENLREAAQRDIDAYRVRSRRRHRRMTGLAVLALLGGAAAASATDLISVGEPLRRPANRTTAYAPDGGTKMQVALTARRAPRCRTAS